jgi:NAD(P)-dependent dehydrogenase (short-subunit alcohol dehydrogenase family)
MGRSAWHVKLSEISHAFITGGASGIGLGTARGLAERGVAVTIADHNRDALEDVLASGQANIRGVHMDVRDRACWAEATTEAERAVGPVDLLFNNAGIASTGYELAEMDPASFDRIIGVNLTGTFNGISAFGSRMRDRGRGHIVSTASIVGLAAPKRGVGGSYVASKFGIVGLSEVLRMEMAPHGVVVSVLCPGYIATGNGRNPIRHPNDSRKVAGLGDTPGGRVDDLVPRLLAGIEANDFYIISHCEDEWVNVESRCKELERTFTSGNTISA